MNNATPTYDFGISVVIPTFEGVQRLPRLLDSLERQSLAPELVELVFVLNGREDGTTDLISKWRDRLQRPGVRVVSSCVAGASRARNIGIALASKKYTTFADDDDELESRFLETALKAARSDACVVMPIVDVDVTTGEEVSSVLARRISILGGTTKPVSWVPWVLGFNACKVLPSELIKKFRYDESLRSGEDVVFFAQLLTVDELPVITVVDTGGCRYRRQLRSFSISRRPESFEFSVSERLECIAALQKIACEERNRPALRFIQEQQWRFVRSYLCQNEREVTRAIDLSQLMGLTSLNWKEVYRDVSRQNTRSNKSVERDRPKALVIAYCFPPYADTGANVLAKRIDRCGEVIDVISVRMTPVRRKDPGTYSIVAPYIRRHVVLPLPPSFGNWRSISLFAVSAALAATLLNRVRKYDTLYSRSMWSASHVAAALVKLKLPKLRWIAEFSDPMRLGIDGRERPGGPATGLIASRLKRAIEAEVKGGYELGSHFHLTEVATLVLADQIVFTNENQRAVMLAGYPERIQKQVLRKSVVCAHPKPSVRIKSMAGDGFVPIKGKINLAYFGSFYGNRGIDSLMEAFASLGRDQKKRFALHIFTDSRMNLAKYVQTDGDRVDLIVHKSLPYLEFLGALEDFDVLIVTDTESIQSGFSANPFLPSKIADYSSTATPVWGIVEPSSPLAMQTLTYRSYIGDLVSYSTVLQAILRDLDTAG